MMVKVLHAADLHLDTPFSGSGLSRDQALRRRADLLSNFRDILALARERQVDLVLIAGDLFEEEYVSRATLERIFSSLAELNPLPVVISPGNHDPFHPASPYAIEGLPPNLNIFREEVIEKLDFPALGAAVHGLAFRSPHESRQLLRDFRVETGGDTAVNILLCHGAVTAGEIGLEGDYLPIDPEQLRACGADYCALGHYHRAVDVWEDGRGLRAAYPGSPEPLRYGQTGDHGVLIVEIESGGGPVSAEKVFTQRRRYHRIALDLSECDDMAAIDRCILSALGDPQYGGGLVELVASGAVPPGIRLNPLDYAEAQSHLFAFRFSDRTRPDYDLEAIAAEGTAKGTFCRQMLERLESASLEEKEMLEQSLWLGLSAFDGHSVEEFPL